MRRCFLHLAWKGRFKWFGWFLLGQIVFFYLVLNQLDDLLNWGEEFPAYRVINETEEALDVRNYLEALVKGTADVAPVVEIAARMPDIYLGCRLGFSEAKVHGQGWLHKNRWYLYSAYEDRRRNSLYPKLDVSIQILASTYHIIDEKDSWYCHIVTRGGQVLRVRVHLRLIWQRAWDPRLTFYNPYLITCGLPNDFNIESGALVTLRGKRCPPRNDTFLKVQLVSELVDRRRYPDPEQIRVSVCVKGLDFFEDNRRELAEWILLQFEFGAQSITIYIYFVPEKTRSLLEEMSKDMDLRLIDLTIPGNVTNEPEDRHTYIWGNFPQKRRNELLAYNDCFYSYAHSHDYVILLDTDELVVPLKHQNWSRLISDFTANFRHNATSLSARNVFKFPSGRDGVGLMGRRHRSSIIQENGVGGKSFIRMSFFSTMKQGYRVPLAIAGVLAVGIFSAWAIRRHLRSRTTRTNKSRSTRSTASQMHSTPTRTLSPSKDAVTSRSHDGSTISDLSSSLCSVDVYTGANKKSLSEDIDTVRRILLRTMRSYLENKSNDASLKICVDFRKGNVDGLCKSNLCSVTVSVV